ncbi:MAG TPA: COX15/CtaA family protein [Tepidisphaeraceae bacterium]
MQSRSYNRSLQMLALAVVCFTFPLIFMGGLVTSHQAGMSVPDWPNSYGYNMFSFPPRLWVGGIFFEHTHRLMGSFVGLLCIALTICAWMTKNPRWVKWVATSVLIAVTIQGILGGLRVDLVNLPLAIVHGCFAQAVFCLAAFMAAISSKWWIQAPKRHGTNTSRRLITLAFVCVGVIYMQLIIGACMRHLKAGLAIPDFPTNYGHILPTGNLQAINDYRVTKLNLDPVTWGQIWLHFAHRMGALVVTILLLSLIAHVIYHNRRDGKLLRPAILLLFLLATQITLGILTVLWRKPADIATAHVAGGALILMVTFLLAVRARHLYSLSPVQTSADEIPAEDLKALPV